MMIDPDELFNSTDAATYLGVTPRRIYALRDQGRIGRKLGSGGYWLYTKSELDRYRATRKTGRPKGYKPPPRKPREKNEG